MIATIVLVALGSGILGFVAGFKSSNEANKVMRETYHYMTLEARHQQGRLSRIIHRQRQQIKSLKAKVPAELKSVGKLAITHPNLPQ